jgi:hypothetical protein
MFPNKATELPDTRFQAGESLQGAFGVVGLQIAAEEPDACFVFSEISLRSGRGAQRVRAFRERPFNGPYNPFQVPEQFPLWGRRRQDHQNEPQDRGDAQIEAIPVDPAALDL